MSVENFTQTRFCTTKMRCRNHLSAPKLSHDIVAVLCFRGSLDLLLLQLGLKFAERLAMSFLLLLEVFYQPILSLPAHYDITLDLFQSLIQTLYQSHPNFIFLVVSISIWDLRQKLFNFYSGSCRGSDVTWQEIGCTCGSVYSCPCPIFIAV